MNSKMRLTLRVSTMCFGFALGALIISSLINVAQTVRAQSAPTERVVYNFRPATGYIPTGVIRDAAGNLYVGTYFGGSNHGCGGGCGNILRLSPPGQATQLYAFVPGSAKAGPLPTGLTRDTKGNLYGATAYGGPPYFLGSVFKLTPSGAEGTLHAFTGGDDGDYPSGGVTIDSAGNLYGATIYGGGTGCSPNPGCGVIYKVTSSGSETVLYSFTGGTDGAVPEASPILDASGNLYGTAAEGGDLSCPISDKGCGTVWKLDTSGNFTVLYSFTGSTDGEGPAAGLVMDPSGNLFGAAAGGGDLSCFPPYGCGVVFKIDTSGDFAVLHAFTGGPNDGQFPLGTLLRTTNGSLFGTTLEGGDQSCSLGDGAGCGVVFKVDASGNETVLHAFAGGSPDGAQPANAALITDGNGNLYGTTQYGGGANGGVIFAVRAY
jgi:uncharacterized repeat protein (TIGR03803 family)